jgi:hypothetical protein
LACMVFKLVNLVLTILIALHGGIASRALRTGIFSLILVGGIIVVVESFPDLLTAEFASGGIFGSNRRTFFLYLELRINRSIFHTITLLS